MLCFKVYKLLFFACPKKRSKRKGTSQGRYCPLNLFVNNFKLEAFAEFASRKYANGGAVILDGSLITFLLL